MEVKEELGKKIRSLRQDKKLTREAFCGEELELTVRQLARIEAGESLPTLPKLTYISQKLSVPIHHLIDEKHMELPKRYLELKFKIAKIPTYDEPEKLRQKEAYFDDIHKNFYNELPEEEQLTVDVLQTSLDVHQSSNIQFGQGIIEEYLFQIENKKNYSINDLLIIELYFVCIYVEGFEENIFTKIVHNVMEQASFLIEEDLFYIKKILLGSTSIMLKYEKYAELFQMIQVLNMLMQRTNDFQQKPIVSMLEGKYFLFEKKDVKHAKEKFNQGCSCAEMFENELLCTRIKDEWKSDYELYITRQM